MISPPSKPNYLVQSKLILMGDIEADVLYLHVSLEYGIWATNGEPARTLFAKNCFKTQKRVRLWSGVDSFVLGFRVFRNNFRPDIVVFWGCLWHIFATMELNNIMGVD